MKRELLIPEDGRINLDLERFSVAVHLGSLSPGSVALELALLRDKLADSLTLRHAALAKGPTVRVRVAECLGRASVSSLGSNRVQLVISPREIEAWLAFFLRYYRDSLAEVDHIDVEANDVNRDGTVEIVVRVGRGKTPATSAETRTTNR